MRKNAIYIVSLLLFLALSLFIPTEEVHFFWEKLPIFNVLFGIIGCIVLIIGSKALGKLFIQKDDDYYD
jgi:hypothetical protein